MTAAPTSDLVRVATSVHEVGRRAWTDLVTKAGAPVFYGWDFLRSVEATPLSRPSQPYYLLLRDAAGALDAAMVLYLQTTRDPFATGPDAATARRMLVGHVWHCYDTVVLTAGPPSTEQVGALWTAMGSLAADLAADLRGLVNIAADGPLAARLADLAVPLEPTAPRYRRTADRPGLTPADHFAAIGRSSRRTMRSYVNRARAAGAVVTFTEAAESLDERVLRLCLATADKHAPGYYPPVELAALLCALGPDCRLLRVELGGELLAVSVCLLDERRAHFWAGGCTYPAELNWSPQYVLFAAELEAGFATGLPELEFGRRNDEFKLRHGLRAQPLVRAVLGEGGD